jgi:hypothetical protein
MITAILICSATVFTSCTNEDNPTIPDNVAEKIIGKWMQNEMNDQPLPINEKKIYTIFSTTKVFAS